jgi:hypothetical protein
MKLTNEQVAAVVTEASKKMSDPNYSAVMVGGFVEGQTPVAQFISAHTDDLGGAESIINVIFHCALVATAFERNRGRVRELTYDDLDNASRGEPLYHLKERQPALHDFILANVEHPESQKLIALIALAIDGAE